MLSINTAIAPGCCSPTPPEFMMEVAWSRALPVRRYTLYVDGVTCPVIHLPDGVFNSDLLYEPQLVIRHALQQLQEY